MAKAPKQTTSVADAAGKTCLVLNPIKLSGRRVAPGESVELDIEVASELAALGAVAPDAPSEPEKQPEG